MGSRQSKASVGRTSSTSTAGDNPGLPRTEEKQVEHMQFHDSEWHVFSLRLAERDVGYIAMKCEPGVRTTRRGLFGRDRVGIELLTWRAFFLDDPDLPWPDGMETVTSELREEMENYQCKLFGAVYELGILPDRESREVFERLFA